MACKPRCPASLVWFRQDLRLADNPALQAAIARGGPVIPVYIWAPEEEGAWAPGSASKWWLHHSLAALAADLEKAGARLVLRRGPTAETLKALLTETGADAVFWNRRYEPAAIERDKAVKEFLKVAGCVAESFNAGLLHEPWTIKNKSGRPFQVFTPFWRHCLSLPDPPEPFSAPRRVPSPRQWPASAKLEEFSFLPLPDWEGGLRNAWQPGGSGAQKALTTFLRSAFARYAEGRDRPDQAGTSRLSPHLHFGEISPRQIWHGLRETAISGAAKPAAPDRQVGMTGWRDSRFIAEVGWREFSHHLLFHFPHTPVQPLRPEFERFRWRHNAEWLAAWQRGQTGYPFVDAGMRQLWTTGWMHNRVRMVAASFLVKHLLISWQEGARWFWDTLVDADLAQNTLGWQWTAGCGADAAPYFRIFNPVAQGEKFDPEGAYLRKWVPELRGLPNEWIYRPHEAPPGVLAGAGVELGKHYPAPIVSHRIAREIALEAYAKLKP